MTSLLRRNIARHIAALANHEGGYQVFGVRDDRAPNPSLLAETTSPQSLSATWLPLSPPVVKS
jgi:hypothetical protein